MRGAVALLVLVAARALEAQGFGFVPRTQPEVRAEVIVARHPSLLPMVGANIPMGFYVRAGAAVGAGASWRHGRTDLAARADLAIRFLLDPFAQNAWGPYVGGGLTASREGSDRAQASLLVLLGVEGHRGHRWTPSVEAALGQGARFAVVLRKSRVNGR